MYDLVTCDIRDRREISKHYSGRYGAPGKKREKKGKPTPEDMARQNAWRKRRYLRRLIELNFGPGDWHVILTCRPEDRPSKEDAPGVIRKFRDRLREEYKKQGWTLKYIITCEIGERGAVHWHMIINHMHNDRTDTAELIRKHWSRGRPKFVPMDDTGEYGKLADYIVKETTKRIEKGETIEKLSYTPSRTLNKPVEKVEKVNARSWKKDPVIGKGWELVPGTLVNGINKFTGLPYQHYTIRRKEGEDADGKHLHRHKHQGASP